MKHSHGDIMPLWEKLGLQKYPPVPCHFSVGDRVIYHNEYGCEFDCDIIGFAKDDNFYGRFIHLIRHGKSESGSAWWFPHTPEAIKKY